MDDAFPQLVRRTFSSLTRDHGFRIVAEDQHHVRFESRAVAVEAWRDPRAELAVNVSPLGSADPHATWTYTAMAGTASLSRLLEIALDEMIATCAVLQGDQAFYQQTAEANRRRSEAWTAYYARKGPRPAEKPR